MLIGVISDTHGSLAAWEKAREGVLAEAELIVHCGDVFYHGARNPLPDGYDTQRLAQAFNAETLPLLFVQGNCDSPVDQLVLSYPMQSPYLEVFDEQRLFVFSHELVTDWEVKLMAYPGAVFVHGHTHVPSVEKTASGFFRLNPGSAALPKEEYPPTAALIENHSQKLKFRIIDIDTSETLLELED